MKPNTNSYSNKKITVTYSPKCCMNSGKCAKQLADVFRTSVIPWINLEAAETSKIIEQINKCPSGALKYLLHDRDVA
ncbi:(4Fe-4S)-binding protein [Winogradskyella aurantiaca]|uniref:(4Fe-4S)-binding protein n=1 Tax=Winogradskyella aurantiaca TaxID=2219558 RepID=UPI000E1DDD84|nr:(4Fe-4S)-binding protein [Winogradskyella aurantiaca]